MTTLILWESNDLIMPADKEDRGKFIMSLMENVKNDMASGATKMWGISSEGGNGYAISEQTDKEIFAQLMKYTPHIKFQVKQMLSADEMIEVLQSMMQK